jgi:hypothetical protein
MNKKTHDRLFKILIERDGPYCASCGRFCTHKSLCIDHKDNNNSNNDLDNLQLLCRSCNTKKNPRGKAKPENKSNDAKILEQSEEIRLKKKYIAIFLPWLEDQIKIYGRVDKKEIIRSGAKVTDASMKTITDYLNVECSLAGRYTIVSDDGKEYVEFKDWWK